MKYKMALYGVMTALLMAGMVKMVHSDDKPADNLSPVEILKKSQDAYDSMTSYSDKGKTVSIGGIVDLDSDTIITAFTTKLARPNLYRIEWETTGNFMRSKGIKPKKNAVWSAGKGDFWDIGNGPEKQKNQHWILVMQSGAGGATVAIPGAFFKTHWSNELEHLGPNVKREADNKVEDTDCYVLSNDGQVKMTLCIGKHDFLIHQIRLIKTGQVNITSTETHSDIVVNQKFSPTDFNP